MLAREWLIESIRHVFGALQKVQPLHCARLAVMMISLRALDASVDRWVLNGYFFFLLPTSPLLPNISNMRLVLQDGEQIQMDAIATFLILLGARMNIFLIIKAKILVLIRWACRSTSRLCWLLSTGCFIIFWACRSQIFRFLKFFFGFFFGYPILESHLITYHSIGTQL